MTKDALRPPQGKPSPRADMGHAARLRLLDFDDLLLLGCLARDMTLAATAKFLGLTQPAITQRTRKIERVFERTLLQKHGRNVRLTREGTEVCRGALAAIEAMESLMAQDQVQRVHLGIANPIDAGFWLPPLAALRDEAPDFIVHAAAVNDKDGRTALDLGELDALLTYRQTLFQDLPRHAVADEEFFLVASPKLAPTLQATADLARHTLLEIDESAHQLRLGSRADELPFKDRWFLGSVRALIQALGQDQGLAFLPHHIAKHLLEAGRIVVVLPEESAFSVSLDLVGRRGEDAVAILARLHEALRKGSL